MVNLIFKCWDHIHHHEIELQPKKVDKFLAKCNSGKQICGKCQGKLAYISQYNSKAFVCKNNHLNIISVFGKPGLLSIRWGPELHENIEGLIEDIPKIKCKICSKKLTECDNTKLTYPQFPNFKTKMKLGDFWDKQRVPEPKIGTIDETRSDPDNPFLSQYKPSEFELRNKQRLKKIKTKRNIPLDKSPGKPIE